MARNAVIDHYRSRQRDEMPMSDQEHYENIIDNREIDTELNVKLDMEKVETYLNYLKEEYRDAIVLRYVEQFSIAEIAHIMQKSTSNVRVILHRALERLRELTKN
jgi:RNA polymerase sigma-70 factor (ECF subfamily)